MRPFLNGPELIFQHDNTRPQTVQVAQDFFRQVEIISKTFVLSDLSPLERVWYQRKHEMLKLHLIYGLVC